MDEQRLIEWRKLCRHICRYTGNGRSYGKCNHPKRKHPTAFRADDVLNTIREYCPIWPTLPKPDTLDEITKSEVGLKRSDPNKKG